VRRSLALSLPPPPLALLAPSFALVTPRAQSLTLLPLSSSWPTRRPVVVSEKEEGKGSSRTTLQSSASCAHLRVGIELETRERLAESPRAQDVDSLSESESGSRSGARTSASLSRSRFSLERSPRAERQSRASVGVTNAAKGRRDKRNLDARREDRARGKRGVTDEEGEEIFCTRRGREALHTRTWLSSRTGEGGGA